MQPSYDDVCRDLARLRRHLERERSIRLQAESIAETGLRDLYEKQQQLQLLEKIATASNRTTSTDEILQFAVTAICEFTDWEVGHSYITSGAADALRLRSTAIWHAPDTRRFDEFRHITEETEFDVGIGLPGRVLAIGKPLWVGDITDDRNFPRLLSALKCGLRGASAFPVLSGDEVVAVLEFFSTSAREPNETVLDLMFHIGTQLGRVIERQRAEARLQERARELARARDAAKAADKAKSAFLATMSHELRTPLNAIIGFSEMMLDAPAGELSDEYRDYAGDINESGKHLQEIINDVLDMSKIEVGRLELRDEIVSIDAIVESCRRVIAAMAETASVSLAVAIPSSLPLIRCDELRMKQVLLNLMSNAVKFTPQEGRVDISAGNGTDGLVITVSDTGIGMKTEDIAVALEPFGQIDGSLSRRYDGTGLGLPLAKALVELHGGALEIRSVLDRGTTVSIRLPRERLIAATA